MDSSGTWYIEYCVTATSVWFQIFLSQQRKACPHQAVTPPPSPLCRFCVCGLVYSGHFHRWTPQQVASVYGFLPSRLMHMTAFIRTSPLLVAKPNISVWTECGLRPPLCLALGTLADGLLSGSLSAALGSTAQSACPGCFGNRPSSFGRTVFLCSILKSGFPKTDPGLLT